MDEIDPIPKLSGNFVWSTSASGHTVKEDFTVPLRCEDENGTSFKHCFLLSQSCPQNLLGRDLMCKLGVCLLASPDGIQVAQCQIKTLATIQQSQLYIYQWKLKDDELCEKLVNAAKDRVSPNSEIMPFSDLHCSAHVSFGRDEMFEQKWFQCTDTIDLKWLIWTENRFAVAVDLRNEQQKFFDVVDSLPHVSLSKKNNDHCEDIGLFVKMCMFHVNWVGTAEEHFECPIQCCLHTECVCMSLLLKLYAQSV